MIKKTLLLLLLVSFQAKPEQNVDEQTEERVECLSQKEADSEQATVLRRKKKCKCFCCIKACAATFEKLTVTGDETISGDLSVDGNVSIDGTLEIAGVPVLSGATGATGATGAIGLTGPTGATGETGATGLGLTTFGYIYNLTPQTVAIEGAVLFDSNGPLSEVTHAPGSDTINVVSAGTYSVLFSVSGTEANQFAIAVNGVPNASTIYGSGAGTQQNTGLSILTLAAGDALTLVNHSSAAAVGLASVVGGTQPNVNASIHIIRLS